MCVIRVFHKTVKNRFMKPLICGLRHCRKKRSQYISHHQRWSGESSPGENSLNCFHEKSYYSAFLLREKPRPQTSVTRLTMRKQSGSMLRARRSSLGYSWLLTTESRTSVEFRR